MSCLEPAYSRIDKTTPMALKILSCLLFNEKDLIVKMRASTLQADRKKLTALVLMGFFSYCNTVFEAMGCFCHFSPCQELRPSLTEKDIKRGKKKRELDELGRDYIREKGFTVIEMWEFEW